MLPTGNTADLNVISETTKMNNLGNAFLPTLGIQANINRDITETEEALSIPLIIKGHIQITFRGSRNSSNTYDGYSYKDPFRSA